MASDTEDTTIRCGNCGFVVPEATRRLGHQEQVIVGLERDLRGKRVRIQNLEGDAKQALKRHPRYDDAKKVLRLWGKLCAPKARELFSDDRVRPTITRLMNGHTVEGLELAVEGYARFPYVVKGRRSETGNEDQRHVEPKTIFLNPEKVEKGIKLAKRAGHTMPGETPAHVDWRQVRRDNHRQIVRILTDEFGTPMYDDLMRCHISTCPKCSNPLRVWDVDTAAHSLLQCVDYGADKPSCDIDERRFFAAYREDS